MEVRNTTPKPILFCDFGGVLCHDRYWNLLPPDQYENVQDILFHNGDTRLVNDWMRGKHTAEDINDMLAEKLGLPPAELWDIFVRDCKTMQVSKEMLEKLSALRKRYTVILITGNMNSFTRFTQPALELEKYFDRISNSFNERMIKTDNNGELFLKYAKEYGVPIESCVAFDDSPTVQKIFTELGGTAYLVTPEQDLAYHLNRFVEK